MHQNTRSTVLLEASLAGGWGGVNMGYCANKLLL